MENIYAILEYLQNQLRKLEKELEGWENMPHGLAQAIARIERLELVATNDDVIPILSSMENKFSHVENWLQNAENKFQGHENKFALLHTTLQEFGNYIFFHKNPS